MNDRNVKLFNMESLVKSWFEKWESGNYKDLPISDDFCHTSPFGTIKGKLEYLKLVADNEDKFLGYRFVIHDKIIGSKHACVRYSAIQNDFKLDVSEWYYSRNGLIDEIVSYYHIGEIQEARKLK